MIWNAHRNKHAQTNWTQDLFSGCGGHSETWQGLQRAADAADGMGDSKPTNKDIASIPGVSDPDVSAADGIKFRRTCRDWIWMVRTRQMCTQILNIRICIFAHVFDMTVQITISKQSRYIHHDECLKRTGCFCAFFASYDNTRKWFEEKAAAQ
ncbi:MAG: hypothetical protein FE78DRAFT_259954 [Acidomyces sp. 'richmondensis']|nr:MAG: hypothetical protein FE78DRAFT_259954 [Acidomyces sp. 'richmondensis']